jgi:hypothetical protein
MHGIRSCNDTMALGIESSPLILPIFHVGFLLTQAFPMKRKNIWTSTLIIVDWNIQIL